jgi:hypothetical protein
MGGGDDGGGDDVVALAATRADVGRRDESGRGMEEDTVMMAVGMSSCGGGAVDDTTRGRGAGDSKRRCRYGGQRRWVNDDGWDLRTDAAMPLSPLTDNGDN